ncbi:hypothetical protein PVBG_02433 [Plasmodium vivax Brazil I]|uniref:PIR Superfamily Protein n=1 Tax=Plasmodium vivax (strain Brazil I) TaxID=1033975 RepID=A0A0J9SN73_PLAV1|nr:hypothetical protein PVBG_02433 [Plasmodium vivax Brazil I]
MDLLACPESSSEVCKIFSLNIDTYNNIKYEYNNKGACIEYYFELYNDVRVEFSNKTLEYVNTIKNYTHPFLKLVSLYLVENYYRAKEYFNTNGDNKHNVACHNLNRWLDQRKNFFTFSEKCNSSVTEWRIHVEELWNTIQKDFGAKHCKRVNKFSNTTVIPPEMLPATCYSSVPEEWLRNFQAQNQKLLNQKNCSNSENSSDKTVIPLLDLSGAVPLVKNSVDLLLLYHGCITADLKKEIVVIIMLNMFHTIHLQDFLQIWMLILRTEEVT